MTTQRVSKEALDAVEESCKKIYTTLDKLNVLEDMKNDIMNLQSQLEKLDTYDKESK